jgi:hypothetical protein
MSAPAQAPPGQQQTQVMGRPQRGSTTRLADPGRAGRWERNIGAIAGLVLMILAWRAGIRLGFPVHPQWAGEFLGFLAELVILAGIAWWTAHLIRVHHRRMIRSAATGTRAGAIAGAQAAGQGYRQLRAWPGPQWAQDRYARRAGRRQAPDAPVGPSPDAGGHLPPVLVSLKVFSEFGGTRGLWLARIEASGGMRLPGGPYAPKVALDSGWRFLQPGEDPDEWLPLPGADAVREGLHGYPLATLHAGSRGHGVSCRCEIWQLISQQLTRQAGAPAPAVPEEKGDPVPMTTTASAVSAALRAPGAWAALERETAGFQASTLGELLEWMDGQSAGVDDFGGAVERLHEHHLSPAIRLDPDAMQLVGDFRDAVTGLAAAMAVARANLAQVYKAPQEFVDDGGLLPKDGDFLTGEDD